MMPYCLKHIIRNPIKSLLVVMISVLITGFTFLYFVNISQYKSNISEAYDTIEVRGEIIHRDNRKDRLFIPVDIIKDIMNTGFISEAYLEVQELLYYIKPLISIGESKDTTSYTFGTNNIREFMPVSSGLISIKYGPEYDDSIFSTDERICIVNEELMERYKLNYGDEIIVSGSFGFEDINNLDGLSFIIGGSYSLKKTDLFYGFSEKDIIVPLRALEDNIYQYLNYKSLEYSPNANYYFYSKAKFVFKNTHRLDEFKNYLKETDFGKPIDSLSNKKVAGLSFLIRDNELNNTVNPLKKSLSFLEKMIPVFIFAICIVAFLSSLLILNVRKKEFAILRALGISRVSIVKSVVVEKTILCFAGIFIAILIFKFLHYDILNLQDNRLFIGLGLYFFVNLIADFIIAIMLNNNKVLYQLSSKEWKYGYIGIKTSIL